MELGLTGLMKSAWIKAACRMFRVLTVKANAESGCRAAWLGEGARPTQHSYEGCLLADMPTGRALLIREIGRNTSQLACACCVHGADPSSLRGPSGDVYSVV